MIILQARSTSKRFPGKILERFGETFMLDHIFKTCDSIERTVVAIPTNDHCIPYLKTSNIPYFEGDENDVLSRYFHCATHFKADWVIRVTADCPLLNPANLLYTMHLYTQHKADFVTNCFYPCIDGQEVEMISYEALSWLHQNADSEYHREHVTTYLKENPSEFAVNFKMITWQDSIDPALIPKMSVDTIDDLRACRKMYNNQVGQVWQSQSL